MATSSIIIINNLICNGEFRFSARGHFAAFCAYPFVLETILCIYIVGAKIPKSSAFLRNQFVTGREAFSSSSSMFSNFPVEKDPPPPKKKLMGPLLLGEAYFLS